MTCCTLGNLEIRTLEPNRFKSQFSDSLNQLYIFFEIAFSYFSFRILNSESSGHNPEIFVKESHRVDFQF